MSLLDQIKDAGVVGAGGAGFPTHIKLACSVEYLIVNAAECEPLLYTDKYILNEYTDEILEAAEATGELVSASKIVFAIKGVNKKEVSALKCGIDRRKSRAEIFELDNYYPAGDEQMAVFDVTGRTVPPGGIPLSVGAVVTNAATMLSIHDAMRGNPVTHKFLTVAGAVKQPMVLRVPVGVTFLQCIEVCGGALHSDFKVIDGGPMMGRIYNGNDSDKLYVDKRTSGIIVIPGSGNFNARLADMDVSRILSRAKSACIQCRFCTDLCPRQLIGHRLRPHMVMRQMSALDASGMAALEAVPEEVIDEALICCECGVCETYACPMGLSPRQVNKYIKTVFAGRRPSPQSGTFVASSLRDYRKIAPSRIMSRMGLENLYAKKPDGFMDISSSIVQIALLQHIGAPAIPIVAVGDRVKRGQLIAGLAEGKPCANVHASITGEVTACGDHIVIKSIGE